MTFLDSNIPMYLIGDGDALKAQACRLLEGLAAQRERLVTDAEVFQEILHRYLAIRRKEAIQPAFFALRSIVDEVFPVTEADVMDARDALLGSLEISARDAIHVAIMRRHGIRRILTFHSGFDAVPGIERLR